MDKVIVIAACLVLGGCATTGTTKLAPIPSDILFCFDKTVKPPMPTKAGLSRKQMFDLVAALVGTDKAKTACGKRLISYYNTQRG